MSRNLGKDPPEAKVSHNSQRMAVSVLFVSENSVAAQVAAAVTRSCVAAVSSDHLPQLQLSCAASGELASSILPELPGQHGLGQHGLELGEAASLASLSADQFDLLVVCGDTGLFPGPVWRYHAAVDRLAWICCAVLCAHCVVCSLCCVPAVLWGCLNYIALH